MDFSNSIDIFIVIGLFFATMNVEDFYEKVTHFFGLPGVVDNEEGIKLKELAASKVPYRDFRRANAIHAVTFLFIAIVLVVHCEIKHLVFSYLILSQLLTIPLLRLSAWISKYHNLEIAKIAQIPLFLLTLVLLVTGISVLDYHYASDFLKPLNNETALKVLYFLLIAAILITSIYNFIRLTLSLKPKQRIIPEDEDSVGPYIPKP